MTRGRRLPAGGKDAARICADGSGETGFLPVSLREITFAFLDSRPARPYNVPIGSEGAAEPLRVGSAVPFKVIGGLDP